MLFNAILTILTFLTNHLDQGIKESPVNNAENSVLMNSVDITQKSTIYIYNDAGTSLPYVWGATVTFNQLLSDQYTFEHINAEGIKAGHWINNAACLIMPGGADLPYLEKLTPEGNEYIKNYVSNGGLYIGFCAGAYYGSKEVIFSPNTDLEVIGPRPLIFFNDTSYGPILAPYDYQSSAGARLAMVAFSSNEHTTDILPIFYNGGGTFVNASFTPNTTVNGYYTNTPLNLTQDPDYEFINEAILNNGAPAIIQTHYSKGRALLFGCHPEMPTLFIKFYHFITQNIHIGAMIPTLESTNSERLLFLAHLLKENGLVTKSTTH